MAGSATAPRTREDTVMPSWAVASIADTCSRPQMTVRARRSPASAQRFDLAAPHGDQGELAADEEVVGDERERAEDELEGGHCDVLPVAVGLSSPSSDGRRPGDLDTLGDVVGDRLDVEQPAVDVDLVAGDRDAVEVVGDQPGEGLVRAVGVRHAERRQLVGADDAVGRQRGRPSA